MATKKLAMSPQAFGRYLKNLERTGTSKANLNRLRKQQKEKTPTKSPPCPKPAFNLKSVMKSAKDMQDSITKLQKTQSSFVRKISKMDKAQLEGKIKHNRKASKKLASVKKNSSPYVYVPQPGNRSPPKMKTPAPAENRMKVKTPPLGRSISALQCGAQRSKCFEMYAWQG